MPTANANTGNGFSKAVSYALQEQKKDVPEQERAVVFEQNNVFGVNSKEIGKQMREIALERETVKKPVLHLQINFHPDEKPSKEQAQNAIDSILKDIGIEKDNHQYVIVNHKDKAHDHYHVIANRVGLDGELLKDHRIKDRLQVACDKVEKEQGLRPTQGRTVIYDPTQEKGFRFATKEEKLEHRAQLKPVIDKNPKIAEVKTDIRKELECVLSKKETQTPDQLLEALKEKGIEVKFIVNKNGISGVSFRTDNIAVKGSTVGYKWSEINKALETNKAQIQSIPAPEQRAATPAENASITLYEAKGTKAIAQYNEVFKSIVHDFNAELDKGTVKIDVEKILLDSLKTNVRSNFEGNLLPIFEEYLKKDIAKLVEAQQAQVKNMAEYKRQLENYELLMSAERQRITPKTTILFKNSEIERRNQELDKRKTEAIKPEFKPAVALSVADFTKPLPFIDPQRIEQKSTEIKHEIHKEVKAVLSKNETQTPEKLLQGLKEKGIEVRFSENESGISHVSFHSQGFSFKGYEVGHADQNINKALNANRLHKTAEIDNAKAYANAVKQTIIQFKDEAQRGNVTFDVQTMFVENIKKYVSQPDAATIQKFQEDLPKFQKAQQQLLHDHKIHQKERKNEVFHPTVHLYDRNFGKNATFKDQELKTHIKENTDQVIKASQSQDQQELKKNRGRGM
jgi:hypothetical protein